MFVVPRDADIASIGVAAVGCCIAIVPLCRVGFRCNGCDSLYRSRPCQFPLCGLSLGRIFVRFGAAGLQRGTHIGSLRSHICGSPPTLVLRCCRLSIRKINDYFVLIGGHNERLFLWQVSVQGIRVALGIVRECRVREAGGRLSN